MEATHENRDRPGTMVLRAHIDAIDWQSCIDRIAMWATRRESRYVCLCNVHSVVAARRDPKFRWIVNRADLAVPDGAPIAWFLRRSGFPAQQRISGTELMWQCCARAEGEGLAIFLYGSTPESLDRLRERLMHAFPALRVAGCHAPPYRQLTHEEDARDVAMIRASGAQIVFVGLGCPKQEAWMAAHRARIGAVLLGVGAAFDFLAGNSRRAPRWMQDAGLEWLHRLLHEPRRLWRRYLFTNTLFCAYVAGELARTYRARR
jgi:N-acetylglucosaminyldiphosphoundecaprenol N-acetyl-beta-D-mannosaminyltransferase